MDVAFWEWMIRGDDSPPHCDAGILGKLGLIKRDGIIKSRNGPWRARDRFDAPPSRVPGPVWNFDRMGQTRTELASGTLVCIAGEHEDSYDPDFHIYNDVVVLGPSDEVEIYGYPKHVFPPTDFHTATFDGDRLIIIGCVGCPEDRVEGHTPVYSLDLANYSIQRIETSGEVPGWISRHEAELDQARQVITVRRGRVMVRRSDNVWFRLNVEEFELSLRTRSWRRLTDRNWAQFTVRPADRKWFRLVVLPDFDQFRPTGVSIEARPSVDGTSLRLVVEGVPVRFIVGTCAVEIVIEGTLPTRVAQRVIDEARRHVESAIRGPCVVDAL